MNISLPPADAPGSGTLFEEAEAEEAVGFEAEEPVNVRPLGSLWEPPKEEKDVFHKVDMLNFVRGAELVWQVRAEAELVRDRSATTVVRRRREGGACSKSWFLTNSEETAKCLNELRFQDRDKGGLKLVTSILEGSDQTDGERRNVRRWIMEALCGHVDENTVDSYNWQQSLKCTTTTPWRPYWTQ